MKQWVLVGDKPVLRDYRSNAMILAAGALLGFLSVAFGAYAEHGLQGTLDAAVYRQVMTALRYHQLHAVVMTAIGLVLLKPEALPAARMLKWASWGFALGIVLFSFSIYAAALLDLPSLTTLAPAGGITLMLSWLTLARAGVKYREG